MLEKYCYCFLLVLLVTFPQLVFAQGSQAPKSRDVLIRESIKNLDSPNIHVAYQAAIDLGLHDAKEAVPAMLRVLQSRRVLSISEHMPKGKNGTSEWVLTDVKGALIHSLGLIGDQRAVPVLKRYLRKPLTNSEVYTGNVAYSLYLLTGKSYEYLSYEGEQKFYEPGPDMEEEFRRVSRPDLKPTEGLTAALDIEPDAAKWFWVTDRPLLINLTITNHSKKAIEIDASVDNFLFSSLVGSGERIDTPASSLPSPKPGADIAMINPGQKLNLRWAVEALKESPLSRGWIGYVNIKCVYTSPQKKQSGAWWRGERLISNSVNRYYDAVTKTSPAN